MNENLLSKWNTCEAIEWKGLGWKRIRQMGSNFGSSKKKKYRPEKQSPWDGKEVRRRRWKSLSSGVGGPEEEAGDAGTVNSVVGGTILMGSRGHSGSLWEWGSERSRGAAAEGLRRGGISGRARRRRRAPDRAGSEEPRGALSGAGAGQSGRGLSRQRA